MAARRVGGIGRAEARATENRNSYLRAWSELENFRKRSDARLQMARKFAIEPSRRNWSPSGDALGGRDQRRCGDPVPALAGKEPKPPWASLYHRLFDKVGSRS